MVYQSSRKYKIEICRIQYFVISFPSRIRSVHIKIQNMLSTLIFTSLIMSAIFENFVYLLAYTWEESVSSASIIFPEQSIQSEVGASFSRLTAFSDKQGDQNRTNVYPTLFYHISVFGFIHNSC